MSRKRRKISSFKTKWLLAAVLVAVAGGVFACLLASETCRILEKPPVEIPK